MLFEQALNLKEFSAFLGKVKWWNMSRKTPEQWFQESDQDNNGGLSKKELAHLLGSEAHIDTFLTEPIRTPLEISIRKKYLLS